MDEFANTDNTKEIILENKPMDQADTKKVGATISNNTLSKPLVIFVVVILLIILGLVVFTIRNKNSDLTGMEEEIIPTLVINESEELSPSSESITDTEIQNGFRDYNLNEIAYAKQGKVVLFFAASWCPTCIRLEADIKNNLSSINSDLLILRVDYDSNPELKSKYGVTYQHTLVQVDQNGDELSKWYGSVDLDSLQSKVI